MSDENSLVDHFDSLGNPKDPNVKEVLPSKPVHSQPHQFSAEERARAKDALKEVTDVPEEFDMSKIGDIDFLLSIFAEQFDNFKSLQYLLKMRETLTKRGYPETPILNEYLFWTTISRRLQIEYQIIHVRNSKQGRIEAEPLGMLKVMKSVTEQITALQKALNETLDKFEKISGIADLHQETLDDIEKFVHEHIGEFSFKCNECGTVVSTNGLPHWAIEVVTDPKGEKVHLIFSPELWYLVKNKLLPIYVMAFVLRTSIEGVLITAKKRGEKIPKFSKDHIVEQENKSKDLYKKFHEII